MKTIVYFKTKDKLSRSKEGRSEPRVCNPRYVGRVKGQEEPPAELGANQYADKESSGKAELVFLLLYYEESNSVIRRLSDEKEVAG